VQAIGARVVRQTWLVWLASLGLLTAVIIAAGPARAEAPATYMQRVAN